MPDIDRATVVLLMESSDAMAEAARRYRISWRIPGDSGPVAGWVNQLDVMQQRIYEHLKGSGR